MKRPGFLLGALSGALLTAPLIAVFFLAYRLAGLSFVPFDVFDWVSRRLPGGVLTFGIESMVRVIRALGLGATDTVAKAAEQAMAVVGVFLAGIVAAAVLFALLSRGRAERPEGWGLGVGLLLGLLAALVSTGLGGAVWALVAFAAWGAALGWSYRGMSSVPVTAEYAAAERMDRRTFLVRLGGASAVITVAGAVVGELLVDRQARTTALAHGAEPWTATHPLPNAGAAVEPVPGTRPEMTPVPEFYRIDIDTRPPVIQAGEWRLRVGGLVEQPLELTLADLQRMEPMHQFATLECISNYVAGDLIGTTRWTGVSLQQLLPALRLRPEATHLYIRSTDGYYESVPLEKIRADPRIMLAYAWNGLPLPTEHGFPLRIYIPNVYGMKQPKWIESIEAVNQWAPGYWVRRGWDKQAVVRATSVIDTVVPPPNEAGGASRPLVSVGGIAFAGARGISRVQVQVDGGPWGDARLRDPLSPVTWVLWRYEWPFEPGRHTFTVRCFDEEGAPQIDEALPPHPAGAAGLHTVRRSL